MLLYGAINYFACNLLSTSAYQYSSLEGLRTGTLRILYCFSFVFILIFILICICIAIASLSLPPSPYPPAPINRIYRLPYTPSNQISLPALPRKPPPLLLHPLFLLLHTVI